METAEIRRRFIDHFKRAGHLEVPSASLIFDDPNLLFVNAGMVPFVPYFLGQEQPPSPRAVSVQKCVRTADIEEVGKTTRHGTFFQMNGNFSFGDYFKAEAITFAWDLITRSQADGGYGFDPDKIWVTIYYDDDETAGLWQRIAGLPERRIQRRGMADNMWSMGIPGPCGPNSEIYIDRGPEYGPDGGPIVDEDRFLEIWNLVFMQNIRGEGGAKDGYQVLGELPRKNIDTGMGLERVAYLLQGVDNLYEIDEVFPVLDAAAEMAGRTYGADHDDDVRLRVIADHVRSSLMLIGDGVRPSNEARGYVVRRLLRRAIRSMRLLGVTDPVLPVLLPISRDRMQASYPNLASDWKRISAIAFEEEQTFTATLKAGTAIFDTAVQQTKAGGRRQLSGERAFALHDTYGFPIDLTLEMAAEAGLSVDEQGFRQLMDEQRQRAKADAKSKRHAHADLSVYRDLRAPGEVEFLGFGELTAESTVRGLLLDGRPVQRASAGQTVELVLEQTPFYAESGGQAADAGAIRGDGVEMVVRDVQRPVKGLPVHTVDIVTGEVHAGQRVSAHVDQAWRRSACAAHSGTHLIHEALHRVLGPTALQRGSYNRPGYLRLDFSWNEAPTSDLRQAVIEVANEAVHDDMPVSASIMPLEQARAAGAMALFGEKYDDQVRVVDIGERWSLELCAGTHVAHSSQVGPMVLTSEASVGAGVRRVEALVGTEAMRFAAREQALVSGLAEELKVRPEELPERVAGLVARLHDAERELERIRAAQVLAAAGEIAAQASEVAGVRLATRHTPDGVGGGDLRKLALDVRSRLGEAGPAVVALAGVADGKPGVVVAVNGPGRDAGLRAGVLVREAAGALGGRGGGKDDIAQGGGSDAGGVDAALTAVAAAVRQAVGTGTSR